MALERGTKPADLFGYLAEFPDEESLTQAAQHVASRGFCRWDAFAPYPIEALHACVKEERPRVALWTLSGGVLGFLTGYLMQWYAAVISYPILVGGKPLNSVPAFLIISLELTILFAALATVLGLFWGLRLPQYYHPLFHIEAFAGASRDRFFLCLESSDPLYAGLGTEQELQAMGAVHVYPVPK